MRVLVVHHGLLPPRPDEADRPVSGGAIRAGWHIAACNAAGHEVTALTRARDTPGGFSDPGDLLRKAIAARPERIICVQPEDAPALAPIGVPMAVDLYAPRLLEAAFEGTLAREATTALQALAVGDVFLVSNPRQRWAWLGILALVGLDTRVDPTRLVALVAEPGAPRVLPAEPLFIAGGAAWAWQDPVPALLRALATLDRLGTGQVVWYGGAPLLDGQAAGGWTLPQHPRLRAGGWLGRRALAEAYRGATAALDWMVPNPERSLAFAFRHTDYLAAGLPILTGPDTALADVLGEAGWIGENVEEIMAEVVHSPAEVLRRGEAARALALHRFSLARCEAPLLDWVASGWRCPRSGPSLADVGALATEAARERALREAQSKALLRSEAEVQDKRAEVAGLSAQVSGLLTIADRLSRALDEVAGFKREAIAVLGGGVAQGQAEARALERELSTTRADLEKKNAELFAAHQLGDRLENDLRAAHAEIERLRSKSFLRR